jgi:cytochrome bd-type quinol oxidase subunit 1
MHLATGRPICRKVFEFRLKISGIAFGMGVVTGIVLAFEIGMNWNVLSKMSGPIQGPLLSYETFTAFFLEAIFFGILVFGLDRVGPRFYLFSAAMVALGTSLSAFWIMCNNRWMPVPTGYVDNLNRKWPLSAVWRRQHCQTMELTAIPLRRITRKLVARLKRSSQDSLAISNFAFARPRERIWNIDPLTLA